MSGFSIGRTGLAAVLLALSLLWSPSADAKHRSSRAHSSKHHSMQKRLSSMGRGASSYIARSSRGKRHHRKTAARPRVHQEIGALILSENGETIMDQMSAVEFNPASAVKIITTYGALSKFGQDHRFATDLYLDGSLDYESGIFSGDLYLRGCDPDLEKKDAEELSQAMKEAGIKEIDGKVFVSPNFSYRSDPDPLRSARSVVSVFHSKKGGHVKIRKGSQISAELPSTAWLAGQFQSESLKDTLKRMMSFSLNRVAEQIGHTVGGVDALETIVSQEAGLAPGSLKLASASGLGQSRVTPRDMMLILKSLRTKLQAQGLDYQDIFPVAGIDRGTLDERFTGAAERGSVVAKTGTLPGTDGGTSALVGMFRSQKENYYFVIFCWKGSVVGFRHQQDQLIRQFQAKNGGPKPFDYRRSFDNES